jgi:integrase
MGVYLRGKSYYVDFYEEGKRYTERVGKVSKSVAEEKLDIRRSEVIRGEWKPKKIHSPFDKFKEQYLEWSKGNKKPTSSLRDESSLKHLSRLFGGKTLSEISPFMVEKYKLTRKEEGAEPATINREMACLRHMFNMAIKWKKAQGNPVREVKFLKEPQGKDRILTEAEEVRLLETVRTEPKQKHLEPIIETALNTGMRKGEILNLKWSNVDLRTGVIVIEESKNGEIRRIPINRKLTITLQNVKKVSKGDFVFSDNGKPYGDVKTGWWTALSKAKIEGLRFHDLRHTFGSRLGMAGIDIRTIQELMGHKDIKMTMRYSHPTPEHKRKAVEVLGKKVTSIFTTVPEMEKEAIAISVGNN